MDVVIFLCLGFMCVVSYRIFIGEYFGKVEDFFWGKILFYKFESILYFLVLFR